MAFLLRRRLRNVSERIAEVRADLRRTEEELAELDDARGDAEVRSLVSETPAAAAEFHDAAKHHGVIARERQRLERDLARLEAKQNDLLERLARS